MATLQKIRNHGVLLLVIVGLAMLAFILGDFLNSGSSFFNRSREYIGVIEGHKIHYTDYEAAKDQLTDFYKMESGNSTVDDETATAIRDQVWESMRWEWTLRTEGDKIGMTITDEELTELTKGQHPHQIITSRRAFSGENGQFSYDQLNNFLRFIDQENEEGDNQNEEIKKMYQSYWKYCVSITRLNRMQEKYTSLVQSLITANNIDAKYQFLANHTSVDAQYVMQPYSAIPDSTITVSDVDIKKLYNQRKKLYKQEPNRSVEYVAFAVAPSKEDFQAAETMLNNLKEEFKTSEDVALVVNNANSNYKYTGFNYSINTIPAEFKDFAFGPSAQKDAFMDLTLTDNTYRMARIMECGYSLPDSVKLRPVVEKNDSVETEEPEAIWYTEAMLTPEIAEKAFKARAGEIFTIPQGANEIKIECVEVTAAKPKVKIAMIENTVTASSKTTSILYNQAKQFLVENPDEVAFRAAAEKQGLNLYPAFNLTKNQNKIGQLKQSREIVRWAFDEKTNEGDLSDVFDCGDQFIVALLSEVSDGEYKSLSEVETELRALATRDAKAQIMIDNLAKASSLTDAAKMANASVDTATSVQMSGAAFGKAGMEPAVVGAAFITEAGKLSAPVKGQQGVYVLVPGNQVVAEGEEDDAAMIEQMNQQNSYYLPYRIMPLLLDQANIEDNRFNFQ